MTVCLLTMGLLLCFLKLFLWWISRRERRKRRTKIIFSRKFQIQRPVSIQIKSKNDTHEGRARISKRSMSDLSTIHESMERSKLLGSFENMDAVCVICLGSYKEGQKLFLLNCGHVYHESCILTWLDDEKCCPVCRNIMTGSDLDFIVETLPLSSKSYSKTSYI